MNTMPLFTDEDLMVDEPETGPEAPDARVKLHQAEEERDLAKMELAKAKNDFQFMQNWNKQLKEELRLERGLRVEAQRKRSAAMPVALFLGAAVLAFLVILATNSLLVADRLGEPLAAFFIGCCAFFAGMVWDRSNVADKMKGGKTGGNGGLQNAG